MDAQQVKNAFGFDVPDLSEASAEGIDLGTGALQFDKNEYTDLGEFL